MKTSIHKPIVILALLPLLFTSCFDSGVDLEGYGDAYILVSSDGQDSLKGLGLHAFSYSEFSSVMVSLTENPDTSFTLNPYMGYKQDFVYLTPKERYSESLPPAGDYVFNATFSDGESLKFFDKLTNEIIFPPEILLCAWVAANERVDVKWETVDKATYYNIKLLNMAGELLFVSPAYNSYATNYSFGLSSQGWISSVQPAAGDMVKVEVAAYMTEGESNEDNLQCISRSVREIRWGE